MPATRDGGSYIPVRSWNDTSTDRDIRVRPVLVNEVLERTDWLEQLRELASAGDLRPHIAKVYAPDDVADAQRLSLAGGARGDPSSSSDHAAARFP